MAAISEETDEFYSAKVGNTDSSSFTRLKELLHCFPSFEVVDGFGDNLATRVFGIQVVAALPSDRPVLRDEFIVSKRNRERKNTYHQE
jgi:hypothetical protein